MIVMLVKLAVDLSLSVAFKKLQLIRAYQV